MSAHERAQVIAYAVLLALIIASMWVVGGTRLRFAWQVGVPAAVAVIGSLALWVLGLFPGTGGS